VDRSGGLDPFLLKAKNDALSDRALKLKRLIAKKQGIAENKAA
jgi:large subunit ribosomal protein L28